MAEDKKPAPAPGCHIVEIVNAAKARVIVGRFKSGDGTRKLARDYGLSRAGVEELIRSYGWLRNGQRPAIRG